jgi:cysteine desulfurase / selenocysteine lyase
MPARLGDRSLFPDLEPFSYCGHAAISPPSLPVRRRVEEALFDHARQGHGAYGPWRERRELLRGRLGALLGAAADDVAFVPSTTRGIGDVALGIPWQRGDRVLLFRGEFPTNITPWQCAAEAHGLELCWLEAGAFDAGDGLELLERELRRGVRLVAVSAVQFQTGLAMPLEAMGRACRNHGAELFVDAIQALGVLPVDVETCQVDYLSSGSHKWLMGAGGCGFLYVRKGCAERLRPVTAGWQSHERGAEFLNSGPDALRYDRPLLRSARVFESSSPFLLACAALEASVELIAELGVPAIHNHVQAWHDALQPALVQRGFVTLRSREPKARSGILSFRPPEPHSAPEIRQRLQGLGITCSAPDGVLRFAPHWPNSLAEVPRVVECVDQALSSRSVRQ